MLIQCTKKLLNELKIKITAKDVGGDYGRTIDLYCKSGKLAIKTINQGVKEV